MIAMCFMFAVPIVALPWMTAGRYGLLPWVSPLHFVAYFAFFGVLIKTVVLAIAPEVMIFSHFIGDENSILWGYLYLLLFIAFLCLGYIGGIRKKTTPDLAALSRLAVDRIKHPLLLAVLGIGVFLLAALSLLSARGIGGLTALFSAEAIHSLNSTKVVTTNSGVGQSFAALKAFFITPPLAMLVWIARHSVYPRAGNIVLILALTATVILSILVEAKRLELLNLLFYYLCISVLMGQRIKGRFLLKLFAVFFVIISLFMVMTTLRATKGGLDELEFALLEPLLQIAGSTYFLDINVPIMIVDRLDQLQLFLGESYSYWLFGWIPRDLWPGKPTVTLGPYVKQVVMGIQGTVGGINPTGAGEAMINFGWGGVFVGAGLGWMYRRIEEFLLRPKVFVVYGGIWMYPLIFFPFLVATLQSSFSATLVTTVFNIVLLRLILKPVSIRWRLRPSPQTYR